MPPSHSPVSLATRQVDGVTVNAVSVGRQLRDRNVDVHKLRRLYVFNVCSIGETGTARDRDMNRAVHSAKMHEVESGLRRAPRSRINMALPGWDSIG